MRKKTSPETELSFLLGYVKGQMTLTACVEDYEVRSKESGSSLPPLKDFKVDADYFKSGAGAILMSLQAANRASWSDQFNVACGDEECNYDILHQAGQGNIL